MSCKKDTPVENSPASGGLTYSDAQLFESASILDSAVLMFGQLANTNTGDYLQDASSSLVSLSEWLETKEGVQEVSITGQAYLDITFTSGMIHTIWLNYVDDEGRAIFRGGGNPEGEDLNSFAKSSASGSACEHPMDNKKILFWRAADDIAFDDLSSIQNQLANHPIDFEIDVLQFSQCDLASFRP
ncbi:MAG: hypothetical protein AAF193_11475, partial [Bacteroidota bacterium]